MSRLLREVRLIPLVLLATTSLFVLKVSGLVFDGGYTLADRLQGRDKGDLKVVPADSVPAEPKIVIAGRDRDAGHDDARGAWAQQMFNYGDGKGDITGSVSGDAKKAEEPKLKVSDKAPGPARLEVSGTTLPIAAGPVPSPGERAVLERLQARRKELDARNHELDMRESLIKAAEKRLEAKIAELKDLESRVNSAAAERKKLEAQRYQSIVAMYENMKPKDAARIFDRLDMKILVEVSTQMKPSKMADILAQMTPEAAERLTVELATRPPDGGAKASLDDLPKIDGRAAAQ